MPSATAKRTRPATTRKPKPTRVSRTRKPDHLKLDEWQTELRRQFGREAPMKIRKLGPEAVFSEFVVTNPETGRSYRVVIRGEARGVNFCSCPDFAVNTLGTCKHIEATLHRLRRRHAKTLRAGYVPTFAEVYVRYGAERCVMFSPGSQCPPSLKKVVTRFFRVDGRLKPNGFAGFNRFLREAARSKHPLRVYDDAVALVAEVRDGRTRRARLDKRYVGAGSASRWRRLLKVPLYPYQREGTLFAARAGRAIVADDMGLGKTIQAIAVAEILAREFGLDRVLIVCPASLKSQWQHEITQFSTRTPLVIEGLMHQRRKLYEQRDAFFKIVNYDVVHRDLDAIGAWSPELVILDEAQRIKNWETRTAKSVKQIESPYALVLTGTPLENRIEELHSIVEFVDRHRLGPLFAFKNAHQIVEEDTTKVIGYRDLGRITKTLAPILIRRTKKQVLTQLPPRMDKNFFVPMTDEQWIPHDENREIVAQLVRRWRTHHFLSEGDQLRLRIALQYMRMACDSTYLVDHETKHGTKVVELATLLDEIFEQRDAKVVIFSQWVRMNELVAEMLESRGFGHVHLHGGVPAKDRKHLTRALREDKACRVFLSTDAGGVGLNLQSASTVINMDMPWNPAVLEQRIGRVHRLGQARPVRVVNFVSQSTIEHGMLSLLAFKKSVFAGVLDGATDRVMMGDSALNRFMKTVETATTSVPPATQTPSDEATGNGRSQTETTRRRADDSLPSPVAVAQERTAGGHVPGLNTQALGQLLAAGSQFLQSLGSALAEPPEPGTDGSKRKMGRGPRVVTDEATGRRELRLTLPDEQTLQHWGGLVQNVLGAISRRGPAARP